MVGALVVAMVAVLLMAVVAVLLVAAAVAAAFVAAEMTLEEEIAGKGWKRNFAPKDEWRKFCVTSRRSSPPPRDEYT